jgi:N-dimethylarginine dimethylaminohydrolase
MIDLSRIAYEHAPLKKVLMHRPEVELSMVTEDTLSYFNFAAVPDVDDFLDEFDALAEAFRQVGTEVVLVNEVLKDDPDALAYISRRANMTYTRDLAVMTPQGALLLGMAIDGRKGDPAIIGRVCEKLGLPVAAALEPEGILEGGGVTYFRGDTVIVGRCDRANPAGLLKTEDVMRRAGLKRMITIPCYPGTVHIDGMLVLIDQDLALVDPTGLDFAPAVIKDLETGEVREQMVMDFLAAEDVEPIVIDESQDGWAAANFVMTAPRQIIGYEWAERVMNEVERRGGKAVGVRGQELRKGNGGPHCMTCALERG